MHWIYPLNIGGKKIMKRTKFLIILLAIMTLFLSACSATKNVNTNDSVEESDIRKLVYNYSVGNIKGEKASITSNELIITKSDGKQEVIDISNEDFFVSIAPYIKETHPCQNHSLTSCQGEMPNTEFYVYIEDFKGNVIVDETKKSFANGFIT